MTAPASDGPTVPSALADLGAGEIGADEALRPPAPTVVFVAPAPSALPPAPEPQVIEQAVPAVDPAPPSGTWTDPNYPGILFGENIA